MWLVLSVGPKNSQNSVGDTGDGPCYGRTRAGRSVRGHSDVLCADACAENALSPSICNNAGAHWPQILLLWKCPFVVQVIPAGVSNAVFVAVAYLVAFTRRQWHRKLTWPCRRTSSRLRDGVSSGRIRKQDFLLKKLLHNVHPCRVRTVGNDPF